MSKTFANHECLKHKKLASELQFQYTAWDLNGQRKTNLTRYPFQQPENPYLTGKSNKQEIC